MNTTKFEQPIKKTSDIAEKEQWLWENKQALNLVLKGIEEAKQDKGKNLGDFSQYADLEIED